MWDKRFSEDFKQRHDAILAGGGPARVDKQHEQGKMTARERLAHFFDKGTFEEVGTYRENRRTSENDKVFPGDGVVTGHGLVNGRLVFACAEDFTVNGGSLGEVHAQKITHIQDMAVKAKAPLVMINDSGGARIEEGVNSVSGYAGIFLRNVQASGVIPQIAVILGPCAGGASYSPALCDFVFMAQSDAKMFVTGPVVVKAAINETITAEELGGADVHASKSGVAHFAYPDDESCLDGVKKLLSYIPQNYKEKAPKENSKAIDDSKKIENIVPDNMRSGYDVKKVIETLVDKNTFFEVQERYAMNAVIGFARLDGNTIGIIANQPYANAGILDINASDKIARFVRFCDCYNIPLLTLVDVPGFMPGSGQEHAGIIRHGAKILYAFSEATVPKVCLVMRKAFGGAYIAMNSKMMGADLVYAWPIAQIAVMGPEGAVDVIYKKEIKASENPKETRRQYIEQYENDFLNPYIGASNGYIDEVIAPEDTRKVISNAFKVLEKKDRTTINKRHGNIPL